MIHIPILDQHLIYTDEQGREFWLGEMPDSYFNVDHDLIVNMTGHFPDSAYGASAPVLTFPMLDDDNPSRLPSYEKLFEFMSMISFMATARKKIYFHCHAGINRSSFMLAMYLVNYYDIPVKQAISLIRTRRYEYCLSNHLFEKRLLEWYADGAMWQKKK